MTTENRRVRAAARDSTSHKHTGTPLFGSAKKPLLKLGAARDAGQFWNAAQALLAQVAPCSTRWLCIRPVGMTTARMLLRETAPGSARSIRRRTPDKPEAALLRELFAHHPAMLHFQTRRGLPLVHLNLEQCSLAEKHARGWPTSNELRFGVALAFWKRKQIQGVLLLHRSGKEGDFSRAELKALRDVRSHLEKALLRVIAARQQQARQHVLAGILKNLPLPFVLCDWRLKTLCESAAGREARTAWAIGENRGRLFKAAGRQPLPQPLANFCRERIAAWEEGAPRERAELEKQEHSLGHPSRRELRATLSLLRRKDFPLVEPLLLLRFAVSPISAEPPLAGKNFAALAQLSTAEREVAVLLHHGHSNKEAARKLGKSLHTIKAQLRSIFAKLKVENRTKLMALLRQ